MFLVNRQDDALDELSLSSGSPLIENRDVFWPKLEDFILSLDPLHLADRMAKQEGNRRHQSNRMRPVLAQIWEHVAFVFGHNGQLSAV